MTQSKIERLSKGFVNKSEAAKLIGVSITILERAIERGQVEPPSHKLDGYHRAFYKSNELEKVKADLTNLKDGPVYVHSLVHDAPSEGLYSTRQAADKLGMPHVTITKWQLKGTVPKPTIYWAKYRSTKVRFYNENDIENIRKIKSEYFAKRTGTKKKEWSELGPSEIASLLRSKAKEVLAAENGRWSVGVVARLQHALGEI